MYLYQDMLHKKLHLLLYFLILPILLISGSIFAAGTSVSLTIVEWTGWKYYTKPKTTTWVNSTTTNSGTIINQENSGNSTLDDDTWGLIEDVLNQFTSNEDGESHGAAEIIYTTIIWGWSEKILNILNNNTEENHDPIYFAWGESIHTQISIVHPEVFDIHNTTQQWVRSQFLTILSHIKKWVISYTYSLSRLAFDLIKGESTRIASIFLTQVMAY